MTEQYEQLHLPLQGEVDLEKIRQEYEAEGLWNDAEKIASRTGYEGADLDDLIQDLALAGLKASRNYRIKSEGDVTSIRSYVYGIMKRSLPRAKSNRTRQSLPYSISREDQEFHYQLKTLVDQGILDENQVREHWEESTRDRSSLGYDFLEIDYGNTEEEPEFSFSCQDDDLTQQKIQAILNGHQMELWTVHLDDIFQERPLDVRRITKDSVLSVWILHRANPDSSSRDLGTLMGHDKNWIDRRLNLAKEAIGRFYQETIPE